MAVIKTWVTKNGHKVYLKKGGSKNVHSDYYRVEGKGVSGMNGTPLHFIDKKRAIEVAEANVNVKNKRYDFNKRKGKQ
tara:strand:+ start:927 stop:1160 length:234 start_codon:yes stop_codon:yes gene_type:complete